MEKENGEFNTSLKTIARSSMIVFIGIIMTKLFTYIYRIIVARQFGPAEYGLFTLAVMITSWFIAISNFGLNQGLVRYIAIFRGKNQIENINSSFKSSLRLASITSILGGIILFLLSETIAINIFHEPAFALYLKFFSITIPLIVILEIYLAVLLGYEKISWYSFIHKILSGLLRIILIIALILIGMGVYSIFYSYIFSFLAVLLLSVLLVKAKYSFLFKKTTLQEKNKKLFREVFSYSWPLLFYGFIWQVFHWTDSFMIGYFKTASDVGIYNAAVPIALLLTAAAQTFMQIFLPIINKEYARKKYGVVKELSQQVGKWIFMVNLPVMALLVIFPDFFINLLFGREYLPAVNSLRLLSIGALFFSVLDVSNKLITMGGGSKLILKDLLAVFVINAILNIVLIPKYGITGAALSTAISFILLGAIFTIQSAKQFSIVPFRRKMLNLFLAALLSTIALLFMKNVIHVTTFSSIILMLFFLVSYALLSLLFRSFDKNDVMILKSIRNKLKRGYLS